MKQQLLWITCILALADCRKYIAPENPFESYKHPNADFIIDPHQLDLREPGALEFHQFRFLQYLVPIVFNHV